MFSAGSVAMTETRPSQTVQNHDSTGVPAPLLSICIATRNRGNVIGATLDNILAQCGPQLEVVVVDGASSDDTATVVRQRAAVHPGLQYFPQASNSGIDGDFDKAVALARGNYCWLLTDDDFLLPGAVARVLGACQLGHEVVIVDAEVFTADLTAKLFARRLPFSGERRYATLDADHFLAECGQHLSFIGAVVIRRTVWLGRERQRYYGTEFIHVGVLFQAALPGSVLAIGEPLIRIRYGVGNWTSRSFSVWMIKWPTLIWSFDWISPLARAAVCPAEPWLSPVNLLRYRAKGWYSWDEFKQYVWPIAAANWRTGVAAIIALLPGSLVNLTALFYARLFMSSQKGGLYDLQQSRYYWRNKNSV